MTNCGHFGWLEQQLQLNFLKNIDDALPEFDTSILEDFEEKESNMEDLGNVKYDMENLENMDSPLNNMKCSPMGNMKYSMQNMRHSMDNMSNIASPTGNMSNVGSPLENMSNMGSPKDNMKYSMENTNHSMENMSNIASLMDNMSNMDSPLDNMRHSTDNMSNMDSPTDNMRPSTSSPTENLDITKHFMEDKSNKLAAFTSSASSRSKDLMPKSTLATPTHTMSTSGRSSLPRLNVDKKLSRQFKVWRKRRETRLIERMRMPEWLANVLSSSEHNPEIVQWVDRKRGIFFIRDPDELARLWGASKGREMTYDNLTKTIRTWYGKQGLWPVNRKMMYALTQQSMQNYLETTQFGAFN